MRFAWLKADRSTHERRCRLEKGRKRRASALSAELLEPRQLLAASSLNAGLPITVPEQTAFVNQVVATITDASATASDYSATIDWGDGSNSTGQVVDGTQSGVFQVLGAHTYADEGGYTVIPSIRKNGGFASTVSLLATVTDPPIVASGGYTIAAVEGTPPAFQLLATFTDPAPETTLPLPYSAAINWGDGSVTAGVVSYNAALGQFQVMGGSDHTYTTSGNQTVIVTLKHDNTPAVTVSDTAMVSDPAIVAQGGFTYAANEGNAPANQKLATFTDPGGAAPLSHYSATIDWGDGQSTPGTVAGSGNQFSVLGAHAYAEEGSGVIQIVINHDASPSVTVSSTYNIADPAVQLVASTLTATEGISVSPTALATFTDPGGPEDVGDYTAQIDWGDGNVSSGEISLSSGSGVYSVAANHVYFSSGSKAIKVTVRHDGAPDAVALGTAVVADVPLLATAGPTFTGVEGALSPSQVLATFSDPGVLQPLAEYEATINWNDGTAPTAGVITFDSGSRLFTVSGQHAYLEEGSHPISVTISDSQATSSTVSLTASVSDPAVQAASGPSLAAVEYATSAMQTLATFVDPGGNEAPSDYSATINWGDGTSSSGLIVADAANATFSVLGSHAYTASGNLTPAVVIHHDSAPDVTVRDNAVVTLPPIKLNPVPTSWVEWTVPVDRNPLLATVSFTDSQMTATIDWGDGATSAGTISYAQLGGVGGVHGTHTYTEAGNFTITVIINDGPQTASSAVPITVLREVLPIAKPSEATPNQYYVAELYTDVLRRQIDYQGVRYWPQLLDQGVPRIAVTDALMNSSEYFSNFVIGPAYQKYLGRAADPAGTLYWVAQMQHGLTDAGLIASLASSAEFFAKSLNSNFIYVGDLYQSILGRTADPQGQAYWARLLNAGASRYSVALGLTMSGEQLSAVVTDDYQRLLDRSPAFSELNTAVSAVAQGTLTDEGLIASLAATDEYFALSQSE
jgi:hypothetical protein